jgi:hypothetical protein
LKTESENFRALVLNFWREMVLFGAKEMGSLVYHFTKCKGKNNMYHECTSPAQPGLAAYTGFAGEVAS